MKCWVARSSNEEIAPALGNKLEALCYLRPRGASASSPASWISLNICLCFHFSFSFLTAPSFSAGTQTLHLCVGCICLTNHKWFIHFFFKNFSGDEMRIWYHCWFAESSNINPTHEKYWAAKSGITNVFWMDDFGLYPPRFYPPPTSSPCCSLPGQAVKRAVMLRTSSRRDSAMGSPLSRPPPSLPHGLDWCVPALFPGRITGIIERHVVLRAKLEPNGSIVWVLLPVAANSPGPEPNKTRSF